MTDVTFYNKTGSDGKFEVQVVHGAVAATARPSSPLSVMWVGTVTPTNAINGDTYLNTGTGDEKVMVSGSFIPLNQASNMATFASLPVPAEKHFFVTASGNDSNNGRSWGSAFATIGAALTAAGTDRCNIQLGYGNFNQAVADTSGNAVTLNYGGSVLEGCGILMTTVTISANVGWGIVAQGAQCRIADLQVNIATGVTVTYGAVGVSTVNKSSGSSESCIFDHIAASAPSGSTVNALFAVGNDTTGGSIDIAFTKFDNCQANGSSGVTHGYYVGNGTAGNILLTELDTCQANFCTYGLTAINTGFTWTHGGMSGITTYDFNYLGGTGDIVAVKDFRGENGKRFFNSNAASGPRPGFFLEDITFGNYTPSDNIIASFNSLCPVTIIGGLWSLTGYTADSVQIQVGNGTRMHQFTAIGAVITNPNGWPAASYLSRTIIGCSTINGSGGSVSDLTHAGAILDGGVVRNTVTKPANYNATLTDSIIVSNGTGLTMSLPDPTLATVGVHYTVVNINASAATVNSQGTSKTINGAASLTLNRWETGTWFSDGTQWIAVTSANPSTLTIAESQVTNLVTDLAAKAPTASPTFTGTVTVPTTVNATDAAQKQYVDAVAQGLSIKSSVKAATSSNTTLSGLTAIDGYTPSANDRILLTGQTTASQNGIWLAQSGAWTRPTDFATGANAAGAFTFVEGGTTNNASGWVEAQTGTITIDTTSQVWTQFSGAGEITVDATLTKSGNQLTRTAVTGDVAIAAGSNSAVLAAVGTAATSGDASHSLTITTDSKGRVTGVTVNAIQITESQVTNLTTDLGNLIPKVPAANLVTANGTYTVPGSGTVLMRITATGAGGGGGGGGSALTSGGVSTQVGGGAGGAGNTTRWVGAVAAGTVLTHTLGTGGAGGTGGAANSNAGGTGGFGGSTTVTGSGVSVTALGGGGSNGGGANSTSPAGGGFGGTGRGAGGAGVNATTIPYPGSGGQAASTAGYPQCPFPIYGTAGGTGGGPASASNGGLGGIAGVIGGSTATTGAGGSGTTAGTNGGSAAANSGCGGGGGGGGAPGGAGGNGGTGGSGWVLYEVIG